MDAPSSCAERIEHGEQCSCKLLAQAAGVDPRNLSFGYCQRVLQRRWRLTCNHGEPSIAPAVTGLAAHWREMGSIDSVKAILMSNDQSAE